MLRDDPVQGALVRFIFPAAPILLEGASPFDSRAWWRLDERELDRALSSGRPLDPRRETPPELPAARERLTALLAEACRAERVAPARVVLGGFSQGAMLALDTALHLPEAVSGLALFSGTLLCEAEWRRLAPSRRGLPFLQSHGSRDPLLSFAAAEALRDLLLGAGLAGEWLPFDGPHTIPPHAVHRFAHFLRRLSASAGEAR
jgi:phospholipase/carboxylesterase